MANARAFRSLGEFFILPPSPINFRKCVLCISINNNSTYIISDLVYVRKEHDIILDELCHCCTLCAKYVLKKYTLQLKNSKKKTNTNMNEQNRNMIYQRNMSCNGWRLKILIPETACLSGCMSTVQITTSLHTHEAFVYSTKCCWRHTTKPRMGTHIYSFHFLFLFLDTKYSVVSNFFFLFHSLNFCRIQLCRPRRLLNLPSG
jgi:hypothetical protein